MGAPRRAGARTGARLASHRPRNAAAGTSAGAGPLRNLRDRPAGPCALLDRPAVRRHPNRAAGHAARAAAVRSIPRPGHPGARPEQFALPRCHDTDVPPAGDRGRPYRRHAVRACAERRTGRSDPARSRAHLPRLRRQLPVHGQAGVRPIDRAGYRAVALALRGQRLHPWRQPEGRRTYGLRRRAGEGAHRAGAGVQRSGDRTAASGCAGNDPAWRTPVRHLPGLRRLSPHSGHRQGRHLQTARLGRHLGHDVRSRPGGGVPLSQHRLPDSDPVPAAIGVQLGQRLHRLATVRVIGGADCRHWPGIATGRIDSAAAARLPTGQRAAERGDAHPARHGGRWRQPVAAAATRQPRHR